MIESLAKWPPGTNIFSETSEEHDSLQEAEDMCLELLEDGRNGVKPEKVWIKKDGEICFEMELDNGCN